MVLFERKRTLIASNHNSLIIETILYHGGHILQNIHYSVVSILKSMFVVLLISEFWMHFKD